MNGVLCHVSVLFPVCCDSKIIYCENLLIFDEVKAYKNGAIFGPPGRMKEESSVKTVNLGMVECDRLKGKLTK